ncbi:MAG: trimethylamine methyltransferase family protein [Proteobacteria bacterium]|nr:trimethylamine methyltransferase family protein [Pseudomonadota bacterium]
MMNPGFNASPLEYLSKTQVNQLHEASLSILQDVGCMIRHEKTLEMLKSKGCKTTSNGLVYIPAELVEWAIEQAPGKITIFDRIRNPALNLQGTNVYFGTGPDCKFVLDTESGDLLDFNLERMIQAVQLADSLPNIDFLMSMALTGELKSGTANLVKFGTMLQYSSKPIVTVLGANIKELEGMVEAAALVAGDRGTLIKEPNFLLLVDPTSPLVHSAEAIEKLAYMATNRLPVIYAPGIMAGASSPITVAGAIAQANAEILAGLVIHQLYTPGAPFVFGGGMSPLDMKSGQPTYSAPEAMTAQAGLCQLGRSLYKLPTWGFGGCSASKLCDEQAVMEASNYLMMSSWMGTNLVHDVGYLEFGLTYSLELLTICDEIIGQIRHLMAGIAVNDDQLALDVIKQVGPSGNFLSEAHTAKHFKNNWQPDLVDRKSRKAWSKRGSSSLLERCRAKIHSIIQHPPSCKLDNEMNRHLTAICGLTGLFKKM